ncbi:hypothetical protein [Lacticaseibacillus suihuaensis]
MNKLTQWYRKPRGWYERRFFRDKLFPNYSRLLRSWGVQGLVGIESGPLEWVLSEWLAIGFFYPYDVQSADGTRRHEHGHSFEAVVTAAARDPLTFSYRGFEASYSRQQLAALDRVREQHIVTPNTHRWRGFLLPERLRGMILEEGIMGKVWLSRDYDPFFRVVRPTFRWYRHGDIILIPDPPPSRRRWGKHLTILGQRLKIPGDFVLCLHCEDWQSPVKRISDLRDDEVAWLRDNVRWRGEPMDWFRYTATGVTRYGLERVDAGLAYHYRTSWERATPYINYGATFENILQALVHDPSDFSIVGYEDDYNAAERAFLDAVQQRYLDPRDADRWQGFSLPEQVHGAYLRLSDETLGYMTVNRDCYVGMRHLQAPFRWYRHGQLLIVPDPVPDAIREQQKRVVAFGMTIEVPGAFVMFMHVDDWEAAPKTISERELSAEEFQNVIKHVSLNGHRVAQAVRSQQSIAIQSNKPAKNNDDSTTDSSGGTFL